jgi:hypothetical protein
MLRSKACVSDCKPSSYLLTNFGKVTFSNMLAFYSETSLRKAHASDWRATFRRMSNSYLQALYVFSGRLVHPQQKGEPFRGG